MVGREIVEKWRREEGWEVVVKLLDECDRVDVRVRIQEGDAWMGEFDRDKHRWATHGGNVFPGPLRTRLEDVMPVKSKGSDGWVQKLLEDGESGGGVRLEFCWVGTKEEVERVGNALDWYGEES